jgi:hypothetical protein
VRKPRPPRWFQRLLRHFVGNMATGDDPEGWLEGWRGALDLTIERTGVDSSLTSSTRRLYAQQLEEMGRWAEARFLREVEVERYRRIDGVDHSETLLSELWLAADLVELKEYEMARALYSHIFEVRHRTLGFDHPDTVEISQALSKFGGI